MQLIIACPVDIDECIELSPCDESATCTNTPGSYACACNEGYTEDNNDTLGSAYSGYQMTCIGKRLCFHFDICVYYNIASPFIFTQFYVVVATDW